MKIPVINYSQTAVRAEKKAQELADQLMKFSTKVGDYDSDSQKIVTDLFQKFLTGYSSVCRYRRCQIKQIEESSLSVDDKTQELNKILTCFEQFSKKFFPVQGAMMQLAEGVLTQGKDYETRIPIPLAEFIELRDGFSRSLNQKLSKLL